MSKRLLLLLFVLGASLLIVSSIAAAPAPTNRAASPFKQIAAPPADFAQLAMPDPAQAGVHSRSALIPVTLAQNGAGQWAWTGRLPVDDGTRVALMLFAPDGETWHLSLQTPDGRFAAAATTEEGEFGLAEQSFPGRLYTFEGVDTGPHLVRIAAASPKNTSGYLLISSQSSIQLYTHLSSYDLRVGEQVGLVTYAYNNGAATGSGAPAPLTNVIQKATVVFTAPDGSQTEVLMADDGLHADGAANDGVFGGLIAAAMTGQYTAQVNVTGAAEKGEFIRTSQHIFPVIAPSLSLNEGVALAADGGDGRLHFSLAAAALTETTGTVQVSAELWGKGQNDMVPVAWIGGMVTPEAAANGWSLPLSLDGRWLALAGTTTGLELRQVRIQDPETHIVISQLDTIALQADTLPANATSPVEAVTDEMLMGTRPAQGQAPEAAGVLMLIHGYCSGGVWPLSQFTQYAQFQDYNQNRSHNQFAQRIDTFGDQFSSFGAVAHSQGGAASLHLYTYYWSGLDYSSGSRRIQSVGTPYQGTSLAGDLAVLGSIFGVGCGTNFDLTYDGSALWLSGIPSWARDDVYYHTTSFKDVWWRYDYCNILSDLLLSDPDDGVVERWSGQLSGGNNLGHKTGWCHTSGMRDPSQTSDSARNSNMNTYGNR